MATSVKLTNESQMKIDALAKAGKIDFRPVLNIIAIGYRKEVELIFDKKQPRATGLRWQPLSSSYSIYKEKNFPGAPLLVRTGDLKASMVSQGAQGNITIIGKTGATFGSSIGYGIFHDKGTKKMPKRNFSEPSDRSMDIWLNQIKDSVIHNFEQNGISVEGGI